MTNKAFFVLEYEWQQYGLPAFISGTFNQPEFEWNFLDPNSLKDVQISKSYEFQVTDPEVTRFEFDFYDPRSPIVSDAFLSVCDALGVIYRAVPLRISFANGGSTEKGFHLFLPCQSASLLNREKSEFREDVVVNTGEVMMDKHFPGHPIYSWIKRFIVTPTSLHLFHCIELIQLVASDKFEALARERGLKGLRFAPINDNYRYDPWGEIQE